MEFLLEIMTEEMPPTHVKGALVQLENRLAEGLIANKLFDRKESFGRIRSFGTCRRLILLGNFVDKQQDKQEAIVGPPKFVAFSVDGSATPAAIGFAKSQGVNVSDLEVIQTGKGDYIGINKIEAGKPASDILEEILPNIITSLSFPKMMRWGNSSFRFSRPIKNILCLFDRKPLRFTINSVSTKNYTTGHKIYSPRKLKVRMEDAKFFWVQDVKSSLKKKSKRLDQIIFQEHLGSYQNKTDRLKKTAAYISDRLELQDEKNAVTGAAELCKTDLMTEMVREFPSLQGKMGGLYAKEEGYAASVWKAIYEHYQPVSLDDSSPSSLTGAILAISDKLDTIVGTTGVGIEVSGSKDPFGIRRNAQGVCKIILDKKLSFSLPRLLDKVINTMKDRLVREKEDVKSYVLDFFKSRLQYIFESQGYRYDLVKASLAPGIDNVFHSFLRLKAMDNLKESPQFEPMIKIAKRVNNILRDQPQHKVNEELLLEKQERELHTTFSIIRDNILPLIAIGDFAKAQRMIFRMRSSINDFFDHVLVMADDKRLRRNRLALLQEISRLLSKIADYSLVVIEG